MCTDWENSEEVSLLDQYLIKMDELMFQNYFSELKGNKSPLYYYALILNINHSS